MKIERLFRGLFKGLSLVIIVSAIGLSACKKKDEKKGPFNDPTLNLKTTNPESLGLLKGTDEPVFSQIDCENSYTYGMVQICSKPHPEYNGSVIGVTNFDEDINFEIGTTDSCFFLGMVHNLILIDTGTGQFRGLEIYDTMGKRQFQSSYINELLLENEHLFYWDEIDQTQLEETPACSEQFENSEFRLGYIAQTQLNLKTLVSESTGKIDCQPFE